MCLKSLILPLHPVAHEQENLEQETKANVFHNFIVYSNVWRLQDIWSSPETRQITFCAWTSVTVHSLLYTIKWKEAKPMLGSCIEPWSFGRAGLFTFVLFFFLIVWVIHQCNNSLWKKNTKKVKLIIPKEITNKPQEKEGTTLLISMININIQAQFCWPFYCLLRVTAR